MDTEPLRRLADQGDPAAEVELARRMLLGKRAGLDPPAAIPLLEKAANGGSAAAKYELSLCLRLGQGVPKPDDARGQSLLDEAAAAGYAPAMVELWERSLAAAGPATAPATAPARDGATAPSSAPAAVLDQQQVMLMARRGEPSAQLALARAVNRKQVRHVDGNEGLSMLLKAAAGEDDRVALAAVELVLKGDGPIRADRPRAALLYRKLAERGLRDAQQQLATLAPESFKGLAKSAAVDRLFDDEGLTGSLVEIAGDIADADAETGRITLRPGGRDVIIRTSPALSAGAQRGRVVRAWGAVEGPGQIRGMIVEIDEPKYQLKYDVISPQVVRPGRTKRYVVEGEFRNTSRQRITRVTLRVRLFQPDTANDETQVVELESIDPGGRVEFKEAFSLEDFRDRASNEKPRVEIKVDSLEW